MNLLLCSPYKGTVGGISRWTHHLLSYYEEYTNNSGINLELFALNRTQKIYASTSIPYRIYSGIKDYYKLIKAFKKKISIKNYDVVHLVSSASLSLIKDLAILYISKKNRQKTIIHFRFGRIPELYKTRNWEQKLLHRVIKASDTVIVIDKTSFDTLINNGYTNIQLLPNPLSPNVSRIIEQNKDIAREKNKLVFAGHVVPSKGIFELIIAAKKIRGIKLTIIGAISNEMLGQINELIGKNNEWITILGEQSYEHTIQQMLSASIFVLPTYTEGFPNVILESMACGCAIIATNVGAIPEMLDVTGSDSCGICIEPKNGEQLEEAISKMLSDKEFSRLCGINARTRVYNSYSMQTIWSQMEAIWTSVKNS